MNSDTAHLLRLAHHAASLTRLKLRIELLAGSPANRGRGHQLRAAYVAYDQVLRLVAGEAGIACPAGAFSAAGRLTVEAELLVAGVRW